MITIQHLELKNFMNISAATFDFKKLVFLYGEPASGKSAVFEAISICLSDEKRSSTYGEYIKQGQDSASILMKFQILGKPAEESITIKPKGVECTLTYDGGTYKNSKAYEKLNDELNMSYISRIAFQMQYDKDIVEQSSASRLEYIKNLFNFDYEKQKDALSEMQAETRQNLDTARQDLARYEALFSESKKIEEVPTLPYTTDEVASFRDKVRVNEDEISKASEIVAKSKEAMNEKATLEKIRYSCETKLEQIESQKPTVARLEAELASHQRAKTVIRKEIEQLENDKASKQSEIEELNKKLFEIGNNLGVATATRQALENRLRKATEHGVCPICGQDTSSKDLADHFRDEIDSARAKAISFDKEYEALKAVIDEKEKSELATIVSDKLAAEHAYQKLLMLADHCETELEKTRLFTKDEAQTRATLVDTLAKLEAIPTVGEMQDLTPLVEENRELSKRISAYEMAVTEISAVTRRNKERADRLVSLNDEIAHVHERIDACEAEKQSYDEAWNILSKLLPQYRANTFCEAIRADLNDFIHTIFPSYSILVKPSKKGCDLLYTKDEKTGTWLDVKMSSGFERAVLNIAFKVTLANYYNISFFIGDEIDRASSDRDSINLFSVLLSQPQFEQIFLISHKKTLGSYLSDNFDSDEISIYEADNGQFVKGN